MTKKFVIACPLLGLAAVLFSTSLAGREPLVVTGDRAKPLHQERVNFDDLDLRHSKARMTLFARVMRASTNVCIEYEGKINIDKVFGGAENTCPNRTYRAARPQITSAIRRAASGQPHANTAVVVAASALAR